jgi:hypothetical protein
MMRCLAGRRIDDRSVGMLTHHHGLVVASPRPVSTQSQEAIRERERLRRELLRRIMERETRRQSFRGLLR